MRYQHTPEASKGNAFCWESWTPQIVWRSPQDASGAKNSQRIENERARGVEPSFVPYVGAARANPLHPSRFQARRKQRT